MGNWGIGALGVSIFAWGSYVWVNKIPSLRKSMWPLWALFALSMLISAAALALKKTTPGIDESFAISTFASFGLFLFFYFTMMRTPRVAGRPQVGAKLPHFELTSETGASISPDDFIGKGPVLVLFFRGFWCISCCEELRSLGEVQKALKAKGGDILAISADPISRLQQGRKDIPDVPCVLIGDEKGVAIQLLQLQHTSFSKVGRMMAIPANILIDKDGKIVWTHYASVAMDRPDPKDVLQRVQAV